MAKDGNAMYETFDSGAGPVVPEKAKGDTAHNDADPTDNGVVHGAVPEMPQVK